LTTVNGARNGAGYKMIRGGTVTGLSIVGIMTQGGDGAGGVTFTVWRANAATSMTVGLAGSAISNIGIVSGSTTSNSFSFSAGEALTVSASVSAAGNTLGIMDEVAALIEIAVPFRTT